MKRYNIVAIFLMLAQASTASAMDWDFWPFNSKKTTKKTELNDTQKFHKAAFTGDKEAVQKMLDEHVVDINVADPKTGVTALMAATIGNKVEVVTLLLEKGADINKTLLDSSLTARMFSKMSLKSALDTTANALFLAMANKESGNEPEIANKIVGLLIEHGADSDEVLHIDWDKMKKTKFLKKGLL